MSAKIASVRCRKILNSHVEFTNEFVVELADSSIGIGAAPRGETISIYEDESIAVDPDWIVKTIGRDGILDSHHTQETFDRYLGDNLSPFGRNNCLALSLAFFNARKTAEPDSPSFEGREGPCDAPSLCLNILNGGRHAYTNPVLSDFSEFLLVSRGNDIGEIIRDHRDIQRAVRERLRGLETAEINDNPVHRFSTPDNRECIDFLLAVLDDLGRSGRYALMIDASGGDLREGDGYRLVLTDNLYRNREKFRTYWATLIAEYPLAFLEDPFHEEDYENWTELTASQNACRIIGDNLYSSDAARIAEGVKRKLSHGVVIKPNQAGTVSAVVGAIETARSAGQTVITSHRSISTESTFLSTLTCAFNIEFIKIGPLLADYSSVVRLNEIIRATERPE